MNYGSPSKLLSNAPNQLRIAPNELILYNILRYQNSKAAKLLLKNGRSFSLDTQILLVEVIELIAVSLKMNVYQNIKIESTKAVKMFCKFYYLLILLTMLFGWAPKRIIWCFNLNVLDNRRHFMVFWCAEPLSKQQRDFVRF